MINFKGAHYPKDVILYAAFFYIRYAVSYRDLEEIMLERGINEYQHCSVSTRIDVFYRYTSSEIFE